MKTQLKQIIERFSQGKVLIVGDVAIDEMVYGHTERLSREAPVVILRHDKTDIILGAAGNAAHNVSALKAGYTGVVAVSGVDDYQPKLQQALQRDGIQTEGLVPDASRPTTTKSRISGTANHSVTQQIVRIDRESRSPISQEVEAQLITAIEKLAPQVNAIILSDYCLGVLTPAIIETSLAVAQKHGILLAVDSQKSLALFPKATIMTPNQPEAEANVGYGLDTEQALYQAGPEILAKTESPYLLITRGQNGMMLFEKSASGDIIATSIPVFNKSEVFDVTGAGDTVIATLTLAMAVGASALEGAILGNLAASIVVRRFGAATTTPGELTAALESLPDTLLQDITRKTLKAVAAPQPAS